MKNNTGLTLLSVAILFMLMFSFAFPAGNSILTMAAAECPPGYSGTYPSCVVTVPGCTNPSAANYNPNATADDGFCKSGHPLVSGCTIPSAANYNPNATVDDGSCKS